MRTITTIFFAFLLSINIIIAQSHEEVVVNTAGADRYTSNYVGEHGMVIVTAKNLNKLRNTNHTLHFYNADLELEKSVPIEIPVGVDYIGTTVIAPGGQYSYYINGIILNKTQTLFQIDENGNQRVVDMGGVKDVGVVRTVFCDEKGIYFLSRMNMNLNETGYFFSGLSRRDPGLELIALDHETLTQKKYALNLPEIEDVAEDSFWEYLGHYENRIYLMSKHNRQKKKEYSCHVIVIDTKGEKVEDFVIEPGLNNTLVQCTQNHILSDGNYHGSNVEFKRMPSGMLSRPNAGAFGGVVMDEENQCIYLYGVTGPYQMSRISGRTNGIFIQKYDFKGKQIWSMAEEVPEKMQKNGAFGAFRAPDYIHSSLLNDGKGHLKLVVSNNEKFHAFIVSEERGESLSNHTKSFKEEVRFDLGLMYLEDTENGKIAEFAKSRKFGQGEESWEQTWFYYNKKSSLLIDYEESRGILKLHSFK